jgi:GAF domain
MTRRTSLIAQMTLAAGLLLALAGSSLLQLKGIPKGLVSILPLIAGMLVMGGITAFKEIRSQHRENEALALLVDLTSTMLETSQDADLRVTLLGVDRTQGRLFQIARKSSQGTTPGSSSMSIHQGVAGMCYRRNAAVAMTLRADDFIEQMVDLGFSRTEAKPLREDRRSFLCIPVMTSDGEVIAIVSIDSKLAEVFTPQHAKIVERLTPYFAGLLTSDHQAS